MIEAHPATSNYTLELPNSPNTFPTYHASELQRHNANDVMLFPGRELDELGPILTKEGLEEYEIDKIVDSRWRGRRWQFLIQWCGYGRHHDCWLSGKEVADCEALDRWIASGGAGSAC